MNLLLTNPLATCKTPERLYRVGSGGWEPSSVLELRHDIVSLGWWGVSDFDVRAGWIVPLCLFIEHGFHTFSTPQCRSETPVEASLQRVHYSYFFRFSRPVWNVTFWRTLLFCGSTVPETAHGSEGSGAVVCRLIEKGTKHLLFIFLCIWIFIERVKMLVVNI